MIAALRKYRTAVLAGKYYWAHRNPQFLALVYGTVLPEDDDREALISWGDRYEQNSRLSGQPVNHFVEMARTPKPRKPKTAKRAGGSKKAKKTAAKRRTYGP